MYPLKETGTAKFFILQLCRKTPISVVHSHCFFEANKVQNLQCCSIKPHWEIWQSWELVAGFREHEVLLKEKFCHVLKELKARW